MSMRKSILNATTYEISRYRWQLFLVTVGFIVVMGIIVAIPISWFLADLGIISQLVLAATICGIVFGGIAESLVWSMENHNE